MIKKSNNLKLIVASIPLGAAAGIVIWTFLKVLSVMTKCLWETLPQYVESPFYTLIMCTIGGLVVGFYRKKFGDYPEEMMVVLGKVKQEKWYDPKKLWILCGAAFLPLVFGSSVGPEAGLVGIITAICYGVADSLKVVNNHSSLSKATKIITYQIAIATALICYAGLSSVFGKAMAGFPTFDLALPQGIDYLMVIIYMIAGCLLAKFYEITHKGCHVVAGRIPSVLRETVAGFCLGITATFVPQVLFSGEEEVHHLMSNYIEYLPWMLLGIAFLKVLLTNVCIQSGLKGGHFFPLIYAGVALGYALAMFLFPANAAEHVIFAAAVVTSVLLGANMKQPLAVTLILLICFPFRMVIWLAIGAFAGSAIMSIKLPVS